MIEAFKTVCDPEIMINIWDMGLVYDIRIADNGNIDIDMTLTAPGCPVAGIFAAAGGGCSRWLRGQASSRSNCLGAGLVDGTPERRCPRDDGIIFKDKPDGYWKN